jgi:cytochrome c oxidase subunit 1
MILPAMGVISEMIACFSAADLWVLFCCFLQFSDCYYWFLCVGTSSLRQQSVGICRSGVLLHYIHCGAFGFQQIKTFNWAATMYKASISYDSPMIFVLGFMGLFLVGGLTGLFLAAVGLDVHLHDTYFVVAHFHYIMVGGAIMGFLGGLHFWWPKITGHMYPELPAKIAAWLVFAGFNLTFFPQFLAGYLGMPRRYHEYPPEFQIFNVASTGGAMVLGIGYLMPMVYLIWSIFRGQKAPANPWQAKGLEWTIPSPPPTENFEHTPIVTEEEYESSNLEAKVG